VYLHTHSPIRLYRVVKQRGNSTEIIDEYFTFSLQRLRSNSGTCVSYITFTSAVQAPVSRLFFGKRGWKLMQPARHEQPFTLSRILNFTEFRILFYPVPNSPSLNPVLNQMAPAYTLKYYLRFILMLSSHYACTPQVISLQVLQLECCTYPAFL
jgi:hypothetical protein